MTANGFIDTATLVRVPVGNAGAFGFLRLDAAAAAVAAQDAVWHETGIRPIFTEPDGLYRNYARQVYWRTYWTRLGKPLNAATPGTSTHGLAISFDVWNISAFNQAQLEAILLRFGYRRTVASETWHFQFFPGTATADISSKPITEEDMPTYEIVQKNGDGTVWWAVDRIHRYAIPTPAVLKDYQYFLSTLGKKADVQLVDSLESFGTPVYTNGSPDSHTQFELVRKTGEATVWLSFNRAVRYAIATEAILHDYQFFLRSIGVSDLVSEVGSVESFGAIMAPSFGGNQGTPLALDPQMLAEAVRAEFQTNPLK